VPAVGGVVLSASKALSSLFSSPGLGFVEVKRALSMGRPTDLKIPAIKLDMFRRASL